MHAYIADQRLEAIHQAYGNGFLDGVNGRDGHMSLYPRPLQGEYSGGYFEGCRAAASQAGNGDKTPKG